MWIVAKYLIYLGLSKSCSVVSDSVTPWTIKFMDSPGQNIGVSRLSVLQGIFPTQVFHIAGRFFTSWATESESESEFTQSCPTLCNLMDCSLSGSSVLGIFQARVLERFAISFCRESSQPRNRTLVSRIAGRCFTVWATRETLKRMIMSQYTGSTKKCGLENEMATHSSILAWKIPWMEEPGALQSMGSQRVGHDWATSLHFLLRNLVETYGNLESSFYWALSRFQGFC